MWEAIKKEKIVLLIWSLLAAAVLIIACEETSKGSIAQKRIDSELAFAKQLDEQLMCAWSNKYSLCFCGNGMGYHTSVLVIAPADRCGK